MPNVERLRGLRSIMVDGITKGKYFNATKWCSCSVRWLMDDGRFKEDGLTAEGFEPKFRDNQAIGYHYGQDALRTFFDLPGEQCDRLFGTTTPSARSVLSSLDVILFPYTWVRSQR